MKCTLKTKDLHNIIFFGLKLYFSKHKTAGNGVCASNSRFKISSSEVQETLEIILPILTDIIFMISA